MAKQCDFVEQCPIAEQFGQQDWDMMLKRYCRGEFRKCHRYQLRQQGNNVEQYLMPWDNITEIDSA